MKKFSLRMLVMMALLAALGVVLKTVLTIPPITLMGFKLADISLTPIPVMLSGIFFGPLAGFIVGFVTDTAGFFLGGQVGGLYNPVFSITMGLFGVIAGLYYLKGRKNTIWRASATAATAQIVCSVVLNTLAVWGFYGLAIAEKLSISHTDVLLTVLLPPRLIGAAIELPLYAWLLMMLAEALRPIVEGRRKTSEITP